MGSGGPRGLQILVSGTFGVRGGFDSHAFPPCFPPRGAFALAVLLLAAACAPVAHAQAAGDSARAVPRVDVVGGPAASPVPARADTARKQPWHEQPRVVMLRSLVVPGWGQFHNRSYPKAVVVAAGEGMLFARIRGDSRDLTQLKAKVDATGRAGDVPGYAAAATEYNAALDRLVGHQWLLGGVVAYALVDAYVDAHFRNFDIEFRTDPALPGGIPPAAPRHANGAPVGRLGLRAAMRWHF